MSAALDLLLVLVGGAAGAELRWLASRRWGRAGTLLANVAGSAGLGAVVGSEPAADAALLLGTGLCGALTTFSTLAWEVATMVGRGTWGAALRYLLTSTVAGLAAAGGGWAATVGLS